MRNSVVKQGSAKRRLAQRFFVCVFALLLTPGQSIARPNPWATRADPVFAKIDTGGLPSPALSGAFAQDRQGFVWIGTQGGIARFDGYRFVVYVPHPTDPTALPEGLINVILPAADGLWLGAGSSGLTHFDAATNTFHTWRVDSAGRSGPRSASVLALASSRDGRLFVGGDAGLDLFDPRRGTFEPLTLRPGRAQPAVRSIVVDRRNRVWVATSGGLYGADAGRLRFHPYRLDGRQDRSTRSLFEDDRGRLWVGSMNALYVLDAQRHLSHVFTSSSSAASLAPGRQLSIVQPRRGVVWVGSDQGAISSIDVANWSVRRTARRSLTAGFYTYLFRDRSGLIWIANGTGGLQIYNPDTHGIRVLRRSQLGLESGAFGVLSQPGALWIAGERLDGLTVLPSRGSWFRTGSTASRRVVYGLFRGSGNLLWIGTTQGLCALPAARSSIHCPAGPPQLHDLRVHAVLEDGTHLVVGTESGMFVEDRKTRAVSIYRGGGGAHDLSSDWVQTLYLDHWGRLWAGTANGLDLVDLTTHAVTRFTFDPHEPNTIGPGLITAILQDRRGRIWAGANGGPLNVMQFLPGGRIRVRHLGLADGLPDQNVDGLAEDPRGRLWASTDKGFALIDEQTLRARPLGLADGVSERAHLAGSVTTSRNGTIIFGGFDGITAIEPNAGSPWTYAPPLAITNLKIGRRDVPAWKYNAGATAALPANSHDITVEFAALDFSDPGALQYAYKLDGYDRNWIYTDVNHRIASYTNLAPGQYTLLIRGTNRLGVWSTHVLALDIVATPAWYQTWWARTLLVLLVFVVLALIHRWRTDVLRQRAHELKATVEQRTHELAVSLDGLKRAQVQLVQQEKMAGLGTLTAGVAHEINNPANFAHLGAQELGNELERFRQFLLAIAGDEGEIVDEIVARVGKLEDRAATITEGTTRIRNLVKDLRAFTRLDEAERKSVRIGDSLESTVNLVRMQYRDVVEIACDLRANPEIECWPALLNQVFMNLIVNACQAIATEKSRRDSSYRGVLHIRSRIEGGDLVLEFEDNGCGIPKSALDRIYEPFFTTKDVGEGTGLGLSISFGIVQRHRGTIAVRSQEGEGTCFTLRLPLYSAVGEGDR